MDREKRFYNWTEEQKRNMEQVTPLNGELKARKINGMDLWTQLKEQTTFSQNCAYC